MNVAGAGGGGSPQGFDPNDPNIKRIQGFTESCYGKTALAGVAGFGLGALFGMFMASMAYDTPFHTPGMPASAGAAAAASQASPAAVVTHHPKLPPYTTGLPRPVTAFGATSVAGAAALPGRGGDWTALPLRQQVALGFRDMGARGYSTAKSFAKVGALFSGIECGIEGLRAKNDLTNGVAAGCLTGAILARNGGPQAAALGCAGFAAFSAAIDTWLRQPKDE